MKTFYNSMASLTKKKSLCKFSQNWIDPFKSHLVKLNDSTGLDLSDFSTEAPSTPPTCQSCIGANCGGDRILERRLVDLRHCPKEQQ